MDVVNLHQEMRLAKQNVCDGQLINKTAKIVIFTSLLYTTHKVLHFHLDI